MKRRFVGPFQPSIRDYCLRNYKANGVIPDEHVDSELKEDPVPSKRTVQEMDQRASSTDQPYSVNMTTGDTKRIDIGLTTEEFLAMPCTPPSRAASPSTCGLCHFRSTLSSHYEALNYSSDMANILEYVRGRPAATDTEKRHLDLDDFDEWLAKSNDDESSDEGDLEYVWPTHDRVLTNVDNGGHQKDAGRSVDRPAIERRLAEDQRIDSLLLPSNEAHSTHHTFMN